MMTFFTAVGSYRIRTEDEHKVVYIQKLGKLYPISTLEFLIWAALLWEVLTYQELKTVFEERTKGLPIEVQGFDTLLDNLLARKLIIRGLGYTGADAAYNMFSDAFVIPCEFSKGKRILRAASLMLKGKLPLREFCRACQEVKLGASEMRVMDLVRQTPLSTAELIRCFDLGLRDVNTPEKLLRGLYPDEDSDQAHIANEEICSENVIAVLQAVSNLYLNRKVILEYT